MLISSEIRSSSGSFESCKIEYFEIMYISRAVAIVKNPKYHLVAVIEVCNKDKVTALFPRTPFLPILWKGTMECWL